MDTITVGSMRGINRKISFVVLLSLGVLLFLPVFSNSDTARADFIDQVNNASNGDTVIITEPYLKPGFLWEPAEKLRSEQLDIDTSITLEGDVKMRIECVQMNIKADDVTLNRFEFSHKQDYISAIKGGQIDKNLREDRADTYDYNELTAKSINNLTVKNCDFKDNNTYYEIWDRPDDQEWYWTLKSRSYKGGGLVRLQGCDTVVFKKCTFANASAYNGGLVQIKNCTNVIFEDCTFSSGMGFSGGGLVNVVDSSNVSFVNCTFDEGITSYVAEGGLVKIYDSSDISFTDCLLKNGSAQQGGGFYILKSKNCVFKTCTIKNCTTHKCHEFWIDARRTIESGMEGGGGLIQNAGNITIENCTFTDNSASPFEDTANNFIFRSWYFFGRGGALAIAKTSNTVTIKNTTFTGNRAYEGGALWTAGGNFVITGCKFSENSADFLWITSQLLLDIIGTVADISGMVADKDVPGILEKVASTALTIATSSDAVRSYLSNETIGPEGGTGGAIYALSSNLEIAGCTFSKNSVRRRGGAIYLISSGSGTELVEIQTSIFSQNSATQKGGALMNLQPGVKVDNCLFSDNEAGNMGGAIYSVEKITVTDTELKENQAKIGGAVCANIIGSRHTYRNCDFTDNVAYHDTQEKKGAGGAVYAHGVKSDNIREPRSLMDLLDWLKITNDPFSDLTPKDNNLLIEDCRFVRNYACQGGALLLSFLHAECKNSYFSTNSASDSGGAICNRDFSNLTVGHCNFTGNQALSYGGAIYNGGGNGGKLHVNRTLFDSNKGTMKGGAVADFSGEFNITNSIFTRGSSGLLMGSALFLNDTRPASVINCTLVANKVNQNAVQATNLSVLTLKNNIITSNWTVENVSDQDVIWSSDSTVIAAYNICALGGGQNNIQEGIDVMVDALNGDFHLRSNFLWGYMGAMEQGLNSAMDKILDFDGNPRIIDNDGNGTATVDLGAYEANHVKIIFEDGHPLNPLDIHGHIDESSESQWIELGGKPDYSAVNAICDSGWAHAGWETFARENIRPAKHHFYQGEKIYATYDRYPTAAYDFGPWGYYDDGTPPMQAVWTTPDCNPLAEPLAGNIKTNSNCIFKGWSTTEGGSVSPLPAYISASTTFYAVYEPRQVHLTFDQYYELEQDPTGDFNCGTRLDLADPAVIALADCDPNGDYLVGFVYGPDDYDPSDQDRINISNFTLDEDVTISGIYTPVLSGSVTIITDITKGAINQAAAESNGFLVDPSNGLAVKNIPDGCEPILQLITPYNRNFTGYAVSSSPNASGGADLVLTAQYIEPDAHEKAQLCLLTLQRLIQSVFENRALQASPPADYSALFVYPYGTVVDLTKAPFLLAPDPGYRFIGWVDAAGNPLTTVTMTSDLKIFPVFEPLKCNLTLTSDGNGIIQAPLLRTYDHGTAIELSAFTVIPDSGFNLEHWENEAGQTIAGSFVIHDDCAIKAIFAPTAFRLTVTIDGNGSVDPSLPGSYLKDSTVALYAHLATPDSGYMFSGFVDENGDPVDSVLMSGDRQVTATFRVEHFSISLVLQNGGNIMSHCYPVGTTVDLSQFNGRNEGYLFTGFSDENGNPVDSVLMNGDRHITGTCTQANYLLNLFALPGGTISGESTRWYPAGTTVNLSQIETAPEDGYILKGFVNENGESVISIDMNCSRQVTAVFELNGTITSIPTLNEWGMICLAGILLLLSINAIRSNKSMHRH